MLETEVPIIPAKDCRLAHLRLHLKSFSVISIRTDMIRWNDSTKVLLIMKQLSDVDFIFSMWICAGAWLRILERSRQDARMWMFRWPEALPVSIYQSVAKLEELMDTGTFVSIYPSVAILDVSIDTGTSCKYLPVRNEIGCFDSQRHLL